VIFLNLNGLSVCMRSLIALSIYRKTPEIELPALIN
jgi:hypothetical protein